MNEKGIPPLLTIIAIAIIILLALPFLGSFILKGATPFIIIGIGLFLVSQMGAAKSVKQSNLLMILGLIIVGGGLLMGSGLFSIALPPGTVGVFESKTLYGFIQGGQDCTQSFLGINLSSICPGGGCQIAYSEAPLDLYGKYYNVNIREGTLGGFSNGALVYLGSVDGTNYFVMNGNDTVQFIRRIVVHTSCGETIRFDGAQIAPAFVKGNLTPEEPNQVCGNRDCEVGENTVNCPFDCPSSPLNYVCGNAVCEINKNESFSNCEQDCPVIPPIIPPIIPPTGGFNWAVLVLPAILILGILIVTGFVLRRK